MQAKFRRGFTLVELLVVIAIIGILAAILIPAIIKFLGKGPELQTVNELKQLDISVNNFKGKFNGLLFPSKIMLSANMSPTNPNYNNPVFQTSLQFITTLWPRIDLSWPPQKGSLPLDWAGTGKPANQLGQTYTLYGDQCLVFFLGGIPLQPHAQNPTPGWAGFSTNPKNPTDVFVLVKNAQGVVVQPPMVAQPPQKDTSRQTLFFYQFESNRLYLRCYAKNAPNLPPGAKPGDQVSPMFYSYLDVFNARDPNDTYNLGQPYIYLSSNRRPNGYVPAPGDVPDLLPGGPYSQQPGLNPIYYNQTTCQIITAGPNGLFGPGGAWLPAQANVIGPAGADDQANFYSASLGTIQ